MIRANPNTWSLRATLLALAAALALPALSQSAPSISLDVYPKSLEDLNEPVVAYIASSASSQVTSCSSVAEGMDCGCQLAMPEYHGGSWSVDTASLGAWKKANRSLSNDGTHKWTNWLLDPAAVTDMSIAEMEADLNGGSLPFRARCHHGSNGWITVNASIRFNLNDYTGGPTAQLVTPPAAGTFRYVWRGYGHDGTLADDYIGSVNGTLDWHLHAWIDSSSNDRVLWEYFHPPVGWREVDMAILAGQQPRFTWRGLGNLPPPALTNPADNSIYAHKGRASNGKATLALWRYKSGRWSPIPPVQPPSVTTVTPTARDLRTTTMTIRLNEGTHGNAQVPAWPRFARFSYGIDGDPREVVSIGFSSNNDDLVRAVNARTWEPQPDFTLTTMNRFRDDWRLLDWHSINVAADSDNVDDVAIITLTPVSSASTEPLQIRVEITDLDPVIRAARQTVNCGATSQKVKLSYTRNGAPASRCEYRDPGSSNWQFMPPLSSGFTVVRFNKVHNDTNIPSCATLGLTSGQAVSRTHEVRCHVPTIWNGYSGNVKPTVATAVGSAAITVLNPAWARISVSPSTVTSSDQTLDITYSRKGDGTSSCWILDFGVWSEYNDLVSTANELTRTRNVSSKASCTSNNVDLTFGVGCSMSGAWFDDMATVRVNIPSAKLTRPSISWSSQGESAGSYTAHLDPVAASELVNGHSLRFKKGRESWQPTQTQVPGSYTLNPQGQWIPKIAGLEHNTTYQIEMKATPAAGSCNTESDWSDTLSITTPQEPIGVVTVTIEAPASKVIDQPSRSNQNNITVRYSASETPSFCEIIDVNSAGIAQGAGVNVTQLARTGGGEFTRSYTGPTTLPATEQTWTFRTNCTYGNRTITDDDTLTIKPAITLEVETIPASGATPPSVTVREGQSPNAIRVRLSRLPAASNPVTVSVSESSSKISLGTQSLTFNSTNGRTWQNISVNALHDSDSRDEGPITVTLTASDGSTDVKPAHVRVNDDDKTYTITLSANDRSLGSTSGGGRYSEGTTATVNATAQTGKRFIGWYEHGIKLTTLSTYSFTVRQNRSLQARFREPLVIRVNYRSGGGTSSRPGVWSVSVTGGALGNQTATARLQGGKFYWVYPHEPEFEIFSLSQIISRGGSLYLVNSFWGIVGYRDSDGQIVQSHALHR